MYQSIALTIPRKAEECGGEEYVPRSIKGHADRVVHASGHYGVQFRAVGSHPVDVSGPVVNDLSAWPLVLLPLEGSLAPVNPTVWPEVWPMQVVGAPVGRLAVKPFDALVGHAIAIRVH